MHRSSCTPNRVHWNIKRIVHQSMATSWSLCMIRYGKHSSELLWFRFSLILILMETHILKQGDFVLKIEPPLGWSFGKTITAASSLFTKYSLCQLLLKKVQLHVFWWLCVSVFVFSPNCHQSRPVLTSMWMELLTSVQKNKTSTLFSQVFQFQERWDLHHFI